MLDTSTMTDTSVMATRLPDIHSNPPLDPWRIVPYDRTLLFNFKDAFQNETDAINAIVAHFNPGNVIAGRQLAVQEKPWMVIEVLFSTEELRTQAIRQGIRYGDATFMPVTTSTTPAKYTVITLSQMALIPEDIRIASFRHWVNVILMDSKATKLTENDIQHIWFQEDETGVYRGVGTVVLNGYDPQLSEARVMRPYIHAPDYPAPQCYIRTGYLYCSYCRILDDHDSVDCIHVDQQPDTPTPKEMVIDLDKEDDDDGSSRRPGKRIRWLLPKPV